MKKKIAKKRPFFPYYPLKLRNIHCKIIVVVLHLATVYIGALIVPKHV